MNTFPSIKDEDASVLTVAVLFIGILGITVGATMALTLYRTRAESNRVCSNEAYYHAENSLNWACQTIADSLVGGTTAPFLRDFSATDAGTNSINIPYLRGLVINSTSGLRNAWVTIANHPSGVTNLYLVTASAQVMERTRTIQASVLKNPPSLVFDYEYFLNNWGWWWGSSITGDGDNRANWDFDFRYSPTVNGSVLANGNISSGEVPVDPLGGTMPFTGSAGASPVDHVHSGAPRIKMPNLLDFTYYRDKATASLGQLSVGAATVVNAVQTSASKPGLYLKGTTAAPIRIKGSVVIPGDVVISGPITGIGTLYVGGNLYVAGDVTYVNGPNFSTPPATLPQAQVDQWVQNAVAANNDLVAFAVRGSVLGGDVNASDFQTWCYYAAGWGLVNLGDENNLGQDGIRATPDDGVPYPHYVGSTYRNDASYDADGDGLLGQNYNLNTDILMTSARANGILNYPVDGGGAPVAYSSVATSAYNRMDGIYYCNHAVACRMAQSGQAVWNGAIICRDEAIVFNDSLKFNYDPRVHSRYSGDPNRVVDLGLPVANLVRLQQINEISPIAGFYHP